LIIELLTFNNIFAGNVVPEELRLFSIGITKDVTEKKLTLYLWFSFTIPRF